MRITFRTRIIAFVLSLAMLVQLAPMQAAAEPANQPAYVDVLRMSFLEGDKLVAAAYGDDQKAKDMHLGDIYCDMALP